MLCARVNDGEVESDVAHLCLPPCVDVDSWFRHFLRRDCKYNDFSLLSSASTQALRGGCGSVPSSQALQGAIGFLVHMSQALGPFAFDLRWCKQRVGLRRSTPSSIFTWTRELNVVQSHAGPSFAASHSAFSSPPSCHSRPGRLSSGPSEIAASASGFCQQPCRFLNGVRPRHVTSGTVSVSAFRMGIACPSGWSPLARDQSQGCHRITAWSTCQAWI